MGMGNQHFHGDDLGGDGNSLLLLELFGWDHENDISPRTGINPNSRELLEDFFPQEFSQGPPWLYRMA